ncbi:ferredoxin [Antrihabitans stalactiti]|uniref:Ferredoxin n=1 Tax=Antrihabitans stalactiti TaxID=2584121 RepID=A0A848KI79_9NOCA|nr:ferredoxin [Antrihabitans stalactiti]NMN95940.1 ferredoxin [Antrihabitans stalactiti]
MKIIVDRGRCEGHGMCESLVPDVFRVDDEGLSTLLRETPLDGELDEVHLAIDSCPVQALSLTTGSPPPVE